MKDWLIKLNKKFNPCEQDDTSLAWRIVSTLFPECYCCAGIRGIVYGIILALLLVGFFK